MLYTPQLFTVCVCRSPICRLIAAEELWTLLDALQEPVPAEVHQHLENISSSTTPLLVSYQYYCFYQGTWICEGMYYYGIKKIGCAGAHAIEVSTQMTFPFPSPLSLFLFLSSLTHSLPPFFSCPFSSLRLTLLVFLLLLLLLVLLVQCFTVLVWWLVGLASSKKMSMVS